MKAKEILDFIHSRDYAYHLNWIDKKTEGFIEPDKKKITINIFLFIATTMIHEYLHEKYPKKKELEILSLEKDVMRKLKKKEIIEIATNTILLSEEGGVR